MVIDTAAAMRRERREQRRQRRRGGEPRYVTGRAAVYIRISNPGDKREASLKTQKAAIMARLREMGYWCNDDDVFEERWTGKGRESLRRPQLARLRQLIREGVYRAVGIYKLDRLSRNMGQTFILLAEMDEREVRPISVMEPNIDDTPAGKMYRMMGAYMGEAEIETLQDRFGRGHDDIASRGLPLARGTKAYGLVFDKRTRTFSLDEDRPDHDGTIKHVRKMFELARDGTSPYAIAVRFTAERITPPAVSMGRKFSKRPHSGRWSAGVVVQMIRNPAYKGWTVENKHYSEGINDAGGSIMRRLPEEEWTIHDKTGRITPRAVDDATWAAANATIDRNARERRHPGKQAHEYLLRGMIYCSRCGAKRYGIVYRHGTVVYRCSTQQQTSQKRRPREATCDAPHIRGDFVEPIVWAAMEAAIRTPGEIERAVLAALAAEHDDTNDRDLILARENLAEQERIREKFYRLWREEEARPECDPELTAKWEADYRSLRGPVESLRQTVATLEQQAARTISPEDLARRAEETFADVRALLLAGQEVPLELKRRTLELARCVVKAEGDGRRLAGARGRGDIHFYLLDEGDDSKGFS
jgi:DNA invertase Pin-like site-specific DNA recombinase